MSTSSPAAGGEERGSRDEAAGGASGAADPVARRQQAIDSLCEAFANDDLDVGEFERRVELAHRADSAKELRALLSDLPSVTLPVPVEAAAPPAERAEPRPRPAAPTHAHATRETDLVVGILGAASRKGRWKAARRSYAITLMGGVTIDLRQAVLPPGVTEVFAFACCGGVEIVAPPGVEVECSGIGIMGGFEDRREGAPAVPAGAPLIRVRGVALMGGVEITVRYPGESKGEARRRIRAERKGRLGRGREAT